MNLRGLCLLSVLAIAPPASAQTTGAGYERLTTSLAANAQMMHATIRRNLLDAASLVPAEGYAFRPTPSVRTFAQVVGHVVNANFFFCAQAGGAQVPAALNHEGLTDKTVLVQALAESFAVCDRVYSATTDATFTQPLQVAAGLGMPGADTIRGAVLMFNVAHNNEHYGNLVVYLRLMGHVPPSTAQAPPPVRR